MEIMPARNSAWFANAARVGFPPDELAAELCLLFTAPLPPPRSRSSSSQTVMTGSICMPPVAAGPLLTSSELLSDDEFLRLSLTSSPACHPPPTCVERDNGDDDAIEPPFMFATPAVALFPPEWLRCLFPPIDVDVGVVVWAAMFE
jgi:hypothetical protein